MSCVVDLYQYNLLNASGMPIVDHMVKKNVWIGGYFDVTSNKAQFVPIDPSKDNKVKFKVGNTDMNLSFDFTGVAAGQPPKISSQTTTNTPFSTGPVAKKFPDFVASGLPLKYGVECCKNNGNSLETFSFMKKNSLRLDFVKVGLVVILLALAITAGYMLLRNKKK